MASAIPCFNGPRGEMNKQKSIYTNVIQVLLGIMPIVEMIKMKTVAQID